MSDFDCIRKNFRLNVFVETFRQKRVVLLLSLFLGLHTYRNFVGS